MDAFVIQGGAPLTGRITVNGSKNAALPLLAAALLTEQPLVFHDVPRLADIASMVQLLEELGCVVQEDSAPASTGEPTRSIGRRLGIQTVNGGASHARYDLVRTMRASICALGPLLARRGQARVSMPGGCAIGDRPVDLHLRGLAALGAEIRLDSGDILATAPGHTASKPGRLKGATVFLGGPFGSTVLGTANVMCAAALAEGRTTIESAACEPEIVDLARLLTAMGANISGAGSPRISIEGVERLAGAEHRVMPDRIEAGTLMIAAVISGGELTIENCPLDSMLAVVDRLERVGVRVETEMDSPINALRATCRVSAPARLNPVQVTTQPHPGFPTDLQAQMMALLSLAEGNSVITERIFPDRFMHVAELSRMGAQLFRQGATVIVSGVGALVGAPVMASDLRASASLVLAAIAARGTTTIHRVYHIDRGYEHLDVALQALGAHIERVDEKSIASGKVESEARLALSAASMR